MRRHARHQSTTRLDVVSLMLDGRTNATTPPTAAARGDKSPCDSLSPLDDQPQPQPQRRAKDGAAMLGDAHVVARYDAGRSSKMQKAPQHAFPPGRHGALPAVNGACSPRSPPRHRPASLELRGSNGCTALPSPELKQRICDTRTHASHTVTQIPVDQREALPPTPTTPFTFTMGNKPSTVSASPGPDDRSMRGVVHRESRRPVSRKISFNLFKRVDSKSPLSRDVTASVMSMLHRDGHGNSDSCTTDDDGLVSVPTDPFFDQHTHDDHGRYPDMGPKIHSASTITMTEEKAGLPLSASTTIRDYRSTEQSPVQSAADEKHLPPLPPHGSHVLSPASPTLPAPSPLPEDSPHKYGLRDKIPTPEVPEQPEKLNVTKMRRKSSGLEIFNEAKSLQSAQSFLNGLSTSRRRAESANDMRITETSDLAYATTTNATSRPASTRPSSTKPRSAYRDTEGRRKGHNFKSSGFAYSRPLTLAQIKCYRGHGRLLPSRNKQAPVECAVCHIDDDADHFSCSWCALRMCKYCRQDFAERGLGGLRERVRKAELGGADDSANSSIESLQELRKSKSTSFA